MNLDDILKKVDHTLLNQESTEKEILAICDDGMKYKTASICIPPSFVKIAKNYVKNNLLICTVVGFPCGYSTTETKVFETENAIANGADEIDMVINIGHLKDKKYKLIEDEISMIKSACKDKVLKVIIETCLLTEEEKIKMCEIVTRQKADFIKTSTGFSTSGATSKDIILFKDNIGADVLIKAAGGISSLDDAKQFINLGASRLGTSKIVKIAKNENSTDRSY